jgi:hypothetical protein
MHLVLVQQFMWQTGCLGEHYTYLIPENELTQAEMGLLGAIHGLSPTELELSREEEAALEAVLQRFAAHNSLVLPEGACITRVCQLFYGS